MIAKDVAAWGVIYGGTALGQLGLSAAGLLTRSQSHAISRLTSHVKDEAWRIYKKTDDLCAAVRYLLGLLGEDDLRYRLFVSNYESWGALFVGWAEETSGRGWRIVLAESCGWSLSNDSKGVVVVAGLNGRRLVLNAMEPIVVCTWKEERIPVCLSYNNFGDGQLYARRK